MRALVVLSIKHVLASRDSTTQNHLVGCTSSLAASLDYAISKEPAWLCEMFGYASTGRPRAGRLFLVTNRNRKRPGPVTISINERALCPQDIEISANGAMISDTATLHTLLGAIEGSKENPLILCAA